MNEYIWKGVYFTPVLQQLGQIIGYTLRLRIVRRIITHYLKYVTKQLKKKKAYSTEINKKKILKTM